VATLQSSIQSQQLSLTALNAVSTQVTTPAPTVPANGWVVYGRITDTNSQPIPKLTVSLTDQERTWQRQYGYAFTDATGYFALTYAPAAATTGAAPAHPPPRRKSHVENTAAETASAPAPEATETSRAESAHAPATSSVFLQALNEAGQVVYFDSQPFSLKAGVALYRNITNVGPQELGTPPAGAPEAPGA
jgi:cell division septation protein DedD